MPSKKSRNRKKNKEKKSKAEVNETDADKKRWVEGDRIHPKGLARALPEVAEALRSGSRSASDVAAELFCIYSSDYEESGLMLPLKDKPTVKEDWIEALIIALGKQAIPVGARPSNAQNKMSYEFYRDFHTSAEKRGLDIFLIFSYPELQEIFDETLERWEPRITSLMAGRPLKDLCPVYKVSEEAFVSFVDGYVENRFDTSRIKDPVFLANKEQAVAKWKTIKRAAQGIVDGDDTIASTCWECDNEDVDVKTCAKCQVACYCGRECQAKSWREGHKQACDGLKLAYEEFKTNRSRVDAALKNGIGTDLLTPNISFDFYLVSGLANKDILPLGYHDPYSYDVEGLSGCFKSPSMDTFYKSLSFIVGGGDHWLFDDTPDPSLADGSYKEDQTHPVEGDDLVKLLALSFILSYDTSDATLEDCTAFKNFCLETKASCEDTDETITAKRFLQMYSSAKYVLSSKEARSLYSVDVYKLMREKYHKKN